MRSTLSARRFVVPYLYVSARMPLGDEGTDAQSNADPAVAATVMSSGARSACESGDVDSFEAAIGAAPGDVSMLFCEAVSCHVLQGDTDLELCGRRRRELKAAGLACTASAFSAVGRCVLCHLDLQLIRYGLHRTLIHPLLLAHHEQALTVICQFLARMVTLRERSTNGCHDGAVPLRLDVYCKILRDGFPDPSLGYRLRHKVSDGVAAALRPVRVPTDVFAEPADPLASRGCVQSLLRLFRVAAA